MILMHQFAEHNVGASYYHSIGRNSHHSTERKVCHHVRSEWKSWLNLV